VRSVCRSFDLSHQSWKRLQHESTSTLRNVHTTRELTDVLDEVVEISVGNQGQDGALKRGNKWWEGEVSAGRLVRTDLEAVLEDAVNDAADTERRLDDGGSVLLLMLSLLTKFKRHEFLRQLHLLARR